MKIALLFAGQGAQYPGMGKDLYDSFPASRAVFDEAGEEIASLCFYGSEEELKQTEITQPTVYTVTMAAYAEFKRQFDQAIEETGKNIQIVAMAGFSLGEYAALTASGIIKNMADGVDLLKHRGQWMSDAGKNEAGESIGRMAAVIGDPEKVAECVKEAIGDGILTAANLNTPTQTVVSGDMWAVERFTEIAKKARLRVAPLSVGSAFHSLMMEPASEKMRILILSKELGTTDLPVYSNLTGEPIQTWRKNGREGAQTKEDIADAMALQLKSSVRWVTTVNNLKKAGIDAVVEIGPGKTLCGLVKKTVKEMQTYNVENTESLKETISALFGNNQE